MNIRFIIFSIIIFLLFVSCVLMHLPDTIALIVLIALMIYGFSNILKNILEIIETLSLKDFSNLTQWLFSPSFVTRSQLKNLLAEKKTDLQKKEQKLIDLQNEAEAVFQRRIESEHAKWQKDLQEMQESIWKTEFLSQIGLFPFLNFTAFDKQTILDAFLKNIEKYNQLFSDTRIIKFSSEWLRFFEYNCLSSQYSFSDDILKQYLQEYKIKFQSKESLCFIADMEGHQFEYWCADLLRNCGYKNVEVTKGSGDQGVDITAEKDNQRYAIQCKRYASKLNNKPIQEVHTGKALYKCDIGVVMTNSHFTPRATELAKATKTLLWDIDEIKQMIDNISLA